MTQLDMHYHEKSAWVCAAMTLSVFGPYFVSLFWWFDPDQVRSIWLMPPFVAAVGLYALLITLTHVYLALRAPRETEQMDERDRAIEAKSSKYAYGVLSTMIGTFLFTPTPWSRELNFSVTSQILLFCFVLSELVRFTTVAWSYRRGV